MGAFVQSNFLQALGWAVLSSLWQLALLWLFYQILTGIFRSTTSSGKSNLATILLIIGFAWFTYTFFNVYITEESQSGFVAIDYNHQLNDWLRNTLPAASLIYLGLLILPLVHYIRNYRYVQAIRSYGLSKADVQWRIFINRVAAEMGIKKPVKIWLSEYVTSPVTIGFLKPIILVPIAAVNHLTADQMEAVLLHELSHIRRYDYFINLIIKFIQSLLYFNPFAKAFVQIIEREREKSCDEMVMQYQYDPHGYATALLQLEKANHLPKTLAVAAAGKKNDLLHRIEWIMGIRKKQIVTFNKLAGLFAGLLFIIALNAVLILSKPGDKQNNASLFASLSPLGFFADDEPVQTQSPIDIPAFETFAEPIVNHIKEEAEKVKQEYAKVKKEKSSKAPAEYISAMDKASSLYQYVAQFENVLPVLDKEEEQQLKEAVGATKKVLEENQWKEIEKNIIADVFSEDEKQQLRKAYQKEMKKVDWKKLENKLRLTYDNINWQKINLQLGSAITQLRMDSLQSVYAHTMRELNSLEKQLNQLNIEAIPDSEISLEAICEKKIDLQKAIDKLKTVRTKKTIHL